MAKPDKPKRGTKSRIVDVILALLIVGSLVVAGVLVWQYKLSEPMPAPEPSAGYTVVPAKVGKPVTGDGRLPVDPDVGVEPSVKEAEKMKPSGSVDDPGPGPNVVIRSRGIWGPLVAAPTRNGEVLLPRHLFRIGVATQAAPLGAAEGTTVVSGHVTVSNVRGALYNLSTVRPGDEVVTTLADGTKQRWIVTSMHQYARPGLPAELFATTGERHLALVTCAGKLVRKPGGGWRHQNNLVVIAVPAP